MRLFTAIDLPAAVLGRAEQLVERLRPAARLQWSPVGNLHITTKFIGEWPEPRLPELTAALAAVKTPGTIPIQVGGVGFFPRVFWLGISSGPALRALAAETEHALEPLGIARESRAYTPHLTLARMRTPVDLAPLRAAIASLPTCDLGAFEAGEFHLYLSRNSVYTKLASFALQ